MDKIFQRIFEGLLIKILLTIFKMLIRKVPLETAKALVVRWTDFYTQVMPEGSREDRRYEIRSDLESEMLEGSATPSDILGRTVRGMPGDVMCILPYLPGATADRLERWSDYLRNLASPKPVILTLAVYIFALLGAWVEYPDGMWLGYLVSANLYLLGAIIFFRYHERPRAQKFLNRLDRIVTIGFNVVSVICAIMCTGIYIWIVVHSGLYRENPLTYQLPLALSPLCLVPILATQKCRDRLFDGRWWPVGVCSGIIAIISLGLVWVVADAPMSLLQTWGGLLLTLTVLVPIVFMAMIMFCMVLAGIVWYCGKRICIASMQFAASGLRRLS